jgi:hypothetical protein
MFFGTGIEANPDELVRDQVRDKVDWTCRLRSFGIELGSFRAPWLHIPDLGPMPQAVEFGAVGTLAAFRHRIDSGSAPRAVGREGPDEPQRIATTIGLWAEPALVKVIPR